MKKCELSLAPWESTLTLLGRLKHNVSVNNLCFVLFLLCNFLVSEMSQSQSFGSQVLTQEDFLVNIQSVC